MTNLSNPPLILVTLYNEIRCLESEDSTICGVVVPYGALSESQLAVLKDSMTELRSLYDRHCHIPQLRLDNDEDIKSLRLICDHCDSRKRLDYLNQFLYLRQHGVYLPALVTLQSLLFATTHRTPFMPKIGNQSLMELFLEDFNYTICRCQINPYSLMNLHALVSKYPEYPEMELDYGGILQVFVYLSQEEQKEMVSSYTPEQVKAVMDYGWYAHCTRLQSFHLERVKKNIPITRYPFVVKNNFNGRIQNTAIPIRAMTLDEAEDFQAILDRTEFVVPGDIYMSSDRISSFIYLYFQLGSTNFEELLYYLRDCKNDAKETKSAVKTLCDSTELQESIIAFSKQAYELPLSLSLALSVLDEELCPS